MGWLAEILEGSRHRISKGQYNSTYGEDRIWDEPSTSMGAWWDSGNEDINGAFAHPFSEEDRKGKRVIDYESHFEEDDQLAKDLQENLTLESPPQYDYGNLFQPYPYFYPPGYRTCAGCNTQIGPTGFLSCMGAVWHPECFRCYACNLPISDYEFSLSENSPFHKHCYRKQHHPRCDVCKNSIPTNMAGLIEYRAHPFWTQKYCPSHEYDRTPRCCSCERMEVS